MLVRRKQEIPKMKLTTGFSLVDTPIKNTTDDDYKSDLIYSGIVGIFRGKVNKGNQIKGTPLINLEDGEGEYNGSYGSTYIKLVGHFIKNKLNGEGNKKISFDSVDNKRHEYEYTGFFENNQLIRGKINYKISDSDSNTIEFSKEGSFYFKDSMEIIKEGTIRRHDGTILQGTFDFKDGFEIFKEGTIRRPDGTILKGTFDFKDGFEIIKEGTIIRSDGTILKGTFYFKDEFAIIKEGTIRRPDGTILQGTFDFKDGFEVIKDGTIRRPDGTILQGTFDFKEGFNFIKEGTMTSPEGTILKGTFDFKYRFEIIKEGTIKRSDGTILKGTFDFKDRRGIIKEGTMTRPDGTILQGTFDFNDGFEIIEDGIINRSDGIILKGTFINNTLNGYGEKIIFSKDNPYQYIYKGLFKDNSLINGVLTNNFSSDIYEGTFEFIKGRDVLKEGKLTRSNGKIYEGTFEYKFTDTKITTKDNEIYYIRRHNGEIYKLTSLVKLQSQTPTLKL